jgi:hypothetical protein
VSAQKVHCVVSHQVGGGGKEVSGEAKGIRPNAAGCEPRQRIVFWLKSCVNMIEYS